MENKTIDLLNKLVEINNDRIEGYNKASEETKDQDLKSLFSELAQNSRKCRSALADEITRLGGQPTDGTTTSGKFYRAWMDVKSALSGNERQAVLNSCEFGEDAAVDTYRDVMSDEKDNLSPSHQNMINEQYGIIKAGHDKIKKMRDELAAKK